MLAILIILDTKKVFLLKTVKDLTKKVILYNLSLGVCNQITFDVDQNKVNVDYVYNYRVWIEIVQRENDMEIILVVKIRICRNKQIHLVSIAVVAKACKVKNF